VADARRLRGLYKCPSQFGARCSRFLAAIFNSANAKEDHIPTLIQPPSVLIRSSCFPRRYAGVGMLLNGDDYRKFAGKAEVVLDMEKRKWIFQIGVAVQNSRPISSHDGHIESGSAIFVYRFKGNLSFGGGIQWNRVISDRNRYQGSRPHIDLVRDILRPTFSMRSGATFLTPNRSKYRLGGGVVIWIPSRATTRHLFFRLRTVINELPRLPGDSHRQGVSEFSVFWRW
jgi:hypothetical protein